MPFRKEMTGGQMDEFTYEIGVENAGERIDKFLSGELSELSVLIFRNF